MAGASVPGTGCQDDRLLCPYCRDEGTLSLPTWELVSLTEIALLFLTANVRLSVNTRAV